MSIFADAMYASGGSIPEGHYALTFNVQMYQAEDRVTKQPKGAARLGVMVDFIPINEQGEAVGEVRQKHYGMGTKAHESFLPSEDGKDVVAVPGAKFGNLMGNTNWAILRKSLVDCGMPQDLPTLAEADGVWVHIQNVPEPEERAGFKKTAATGEMQEEERKGPGTVAVVSEILDGGKPWEGTGGVPEVAETPATPTPAPAARPVAARGAARPTAVAPKPAAAKAAAPKAAAAKAAPAGDDDARVLAVSLISAELEGMMNRHETSIKRLKLRTEVFKKAGENGNAVIDAAFKDDDTLSGVLNSLGFKVEGGEVSAQ